MGLLEIGSSALRAASTQISVTGNNIANASTVGYHRQNALQSDAGSQRTDSGYIGMGVRIDDVRRQYDAFVERAVASNEATAAADAARKSQVGSLEQLFADSGSGLGSAMNGLRTALADLVAAPNNASAKTVVLSRADALAAQISRLDDQLNQMGTDNAQRMSSDVDSLNGLLGDLSAVNREIISAGIYGHSPNELLDRRDLLIGKVNQLAQANTYLNADGTANLYTTTGEPLVVNEWAATFSLTPDAYGSGAPQLNLKTPNAELPVDAAALGGGSLSGLMRFHGEDLASARARLGQMAAGIGTTFNAVQANGVDASGNAGQPMFSWTAPSVAAATGNPSSAAMSATVADASALQASDYEISFDGSNYQVLRKADGQKTTLPSLPLAFDGLRIALDAGGPVAGDRFLVRSASTFASGFALELGSGDELATGLAVAPTVPGANAGSLAVAKFSVADAANANLASPVTLTFDGTGGFSVSGSGTGNPSNLGYVAGTPISYNGWSVTLTGTPSAGDTITLGPSSAGTADNRGAKALFEAVDAASVGGGSFNDAYADLVADVGSRTSWANAASDYSTAMLANAKATRDGVSGVNLDEEAARLLQFQQAYQAAAKLITTSQTLFASLMDAVGS